MMEPPPLRTISGMACLQVSIWLVRLTAIVRSHTSRSRSVTGVSRFRKSESVRAALLCSTSSRPKWSTTVRTAPTTPASSDRSASTASDRPPDALISAATRSAPAPSMSRTATEAPSRARARAVAPPMPPAPPVTMATLPSTRPCCSSLTSGSPPLGSGPGAACCRRHGSPSAPDRCMVVGRVVISRRHRSDHPPPAPATEPPAPGRTGGTSS